LAHECSSSRRSRKGNYYPSRFIYSDDQNRSVMVPSQGIIEALTKVYNAKPLADELLG